MRPFLLIVFALVLFGCDSTQWRRDTVQPIDQKIVADIFGISQLPPTTSIKRAHYVPGGLGAPGLLLYDLSCTSPDLTILMKDSKNTRLPHGSEKIYPADTSLRMQFGVEPYDMPAYSVLRTKKDREYTYPLESYIVVDESTTPSLKIYIQTDASYVFMFKD